MVRFSHIVYEHRALITDACLQIRVATEYDMPKCWRNRRVECATKPLAPTSSVNNLQVHPAAFASMTKEAYLSSFLASALGMPYSAGQVNSPRSTLLIDFDQRMISGQRIVSMMSGGNTIGA